jgi:hypothetical protein
MSNVSAIHLHEALKAKGLRIIHTEVPEDYNLIDDLRDPLIHEVVVASAREIEFEQRLQQPAS